MRIGSESCRWGRVGCLLEIMLAVLFALVHLVVAWRLSRLWPQVMTIPPGSPIRRLFMLYWWPSFQLLDAFTGAMGVPRAGGLSNLLLLPLSWVTCFVYGWITSLLICLPIRFLKRQRYR